LEFDLEDGICTTNIVRTANEAALVERASEKVEQVEKERQKTQNVPESKRETA
jgi:hypothetical protein